MIKNQLNKYVSNWFFISLCAYAFVLPLSQALVSIMAGVLVFIALIEDSWKNKIERVKENRYILLISGVFLIYFLYSGVNNNLAESVYDFKKALFFLILPFGFVFGKKISGKQVRIVFYVFSAGIVIATIVALVNWINLSSGSIFKVHEASLISHIRFSFQLVLAFWFYILIVGLNFKNEKKSTLLFFLGSSIYFLVFLFFQQSLTGIIGLLGSVLVYGGILLKSKKRVRPWLVITFLGLIIVPVLYVGWVVYNFYNFEKVNPQTIDKKTAHGNLYWHDFSNKSVENGHFVYLYMCEPEMREEWNKKSEMKFDSIAKNGFPVSSTLIRYLTSKGLRKDAEGVKALTKNDVQNIENCIANVIYDKNNFSLYPRIYQTVWEYYVYSTTGNANNQSFSQRIEFSKAAITILKQNFWFGVGPGNWKTKFIEAYHQNNSTLNPKYYASSHNQYLNYLVKFGVFGFLIIFLIILIPIIKFNKFNDPLFVVFIAFMFFANFGDSNFESHMGSAFFVFFYCLFLVARNKNYLQISNK